MIFDLTIPTEGVVNFLVMDFNVGRFEFDTVVLVFPRKFTSPNAIVKKRVLRGWKCGFAPAKKTPEACQYDSIKRLLGTKNTQGHGKQFHPFVPFKSMKQ